MKTLDEMADVRERVGLSDVDVLKRWLVDTGRRYLIFDSIQLVGSLSFEGLKSIQCIIQAYREYRMGIPTGEKEIIPNPIDGSDCEVAVMYTDTFNLEELKAVHRYIVGQITDLDPSWTF